MGRVRYVGEWGEKRLILLRQLQAEKPEIPWHHGSFGVVHMALNIDGGAILNIRNYINLIESTTNSVLFHGSRTDIEIGTVLTGRPIKHTDRESKLVEAVLEHYRPKNCLPRNQSVFMVDTPDIDVIEKVGGYADYIFSVQPLGNVEKNDVFWWAQIYSLAEDSKSLDELKNRAATDANNYWSGEPSRRTRWEYRTDKAKVMQMVGGYRGDNA